MQVGPRLRARLRERRQELGLTQREVGERAGFSQYYISNLETGQVSQTPEDTLLRVCDALSLPPPFGRVRQRGQALSDVRHWLGLTIREVADALADRHARTGLPLLSLERLVDLESDTAENVMVQELEQLAWLYQVAWRVGPAGYRWELARDE